MHRVMAAGLGWARVSMLAALTLIAAAAPAGAKAKPAGVRAGGQTGGSNLTLAMGASANFQNLKLEFLSVVADNRCPKGTICAQAGNATVQLRGSLLGGAQKDSIDSGMRASVAELSTSTEPKLGTFGDYTVSLVSLTPLPTAKGAPAKTAYKLTVHVAPVPAPVAPAVLSLGPGQEGSFDGLKLTFVKVLSDSRCPQGAVCVQAGRVEVQVSVTGPGMTPSPKLITLSSSGNPGEETVAGVLVRFTSLEPLPSVAGMVEAPGKPKTMPRPPVLTLSVSKPAAPKDKI